MIHWGIIGAGKIAHRFAQSIQTIENATLTVVANRTKEKALAFQKEFDVTYAYTDYQKVLDSPDVDMVYISLPHAYHYEWIKKAILANKAVLCEKPIVLNANELKDILSLLKEKPVFFMEAMKSRFAPAYIAAKNLILDETIGELLSIDTTLRRYMPKESTTYHYDAVQGGCLLDMGIYNISLIDDFVSSPPMIQTLNYEHLDHLVEIFVEATLRSDSIDLSIEVGFDQYKDAEAIFTGTKGQLILTDFHRPTTFTLNLTGKEPQKFTYPYLIDDFDAEITHAMSCFSNGNYESSIMPWQDSLNCMELIDQLKKQMNDF